MLKIDLSVDFMLFIISKPMNLTHRIKGMKVKIQMLTSIIPKTYPIKYKYFHN